MSLNDVMKNHMDAVRDVTGASGLLSMAMATDALNDAESGLLRNKYIVIGDKLSADDIVDQGNYATGGVDMTASKNAGIPGKQENGYGTLIVLKNSYYVMQFWLDTQFGSSNVVPFSIWYRAKNWHDNLNWSPWNKLGGIINPVLSAFKRVAAPLMGGVAYAA